MVTECGPKINGQTNLYSLAYENYIFTQNFVESKLKIKIDKDFHANENRILFAFPE